MTTAAVVDTNVILVAQGLHETMSARCKATCAATLGRFHKEELALALDHLYIIINEYKTMLHPYRPGVGNAFLKWVLTNLANPGRVVRVNVTPRDDQRAFDEFPASAELTSFDPSDRVFVAVACAHEESPPIFQAADSKWIGWHAALEAEGVTVEFLCKDELNAKYSQKFPAKPNIPKNDPAK